MEWGPPDPELYQFVVQAAGVGVWTWDVVRDELSADARCREMIDPAPSDSVFRRAAEARGDFDYVQRVTTPAGDFRWVRLSGRAVGGEDGEVVRCLGVMREVTDEHSVRESEARLRFVLAATHDGVWEVDVPTGRVWWSDEMLETLGLPRDRCPRDLDAVLALMHPEDRPRALAAIESVVAGRAGPRCGTVRMRGSEGTWRRLDSWAVVEPHPESGAAMRVLGIVRDRTDAASRADPSRELARRLNEAVLDPLEIAARHVKLAAVALGSSADQAGDLIDVSSVHLGRARDAVEALIQSALPGAD